ncbi:methyltransferase domain-containing protein [Phenylobacterium sp.]|jgi:SAM-dependent methyltransferase|uniref:class I SAM-dependent methyltransferase n=1 Tax=Phenylobacterium sp. TaxID=1871053 RepID=UPI00183A3E80|nr:methyltransferase domain-containing protein [Phenylobacterium sp.]MBA4794311.1 methyltransferase domain-containing protein [Phenylobacterium sp.]MBC7166794.1 methyltransferase domain-containing protein [Phenylobacterium sp.]
MRRDILELRAFYASDLGRAARVMIGRKVTEAWGDARGLDVLGLGYATPFLGPLRERARRTVAAMPAQQGVEIWPGGAGNLTTLVNEDALPFRNALFDRILVVHAIEESDDAAALLREVWRVLAPSGRVIVAVAARDGLWANAESTPLGHGRPYTRRQLAALMREAELEPSGYTRALYVPPAPWMAGWAEPFEQAGSRLWRRFAGVVLMEAVKQTYAIKARPQRARTRLARPVLAPVPAAREAVRRNPSADEAVRPGA